MKQTISLLLLNNFHPVISYRRIIVHSSVARYGPRTMLPSAKGLKSEQYKIQIRENEIACTVSSDTYHGKNVSHDP